MEGNPWDRRPYLTGAHMQMYPVCRCLECKHAAECCADDYRVTGYTCTSPDCFRRDNVHVVPAIRPPKGTILRTTSMKIPSGLSHTRYQRPPRLSFGIDEILKDRLHRTPGELLFRDFLLPYYPTTPHSGACTYIQNSPFL